MSTLTNQRHERFAQLLAKGKTGDEAYVECGYKPNRHNASRLKTTENISARVAEILERSAVRTEITVAGITDRLLKIAEKGETTAEAPMLAVARAALMDAAKLNGLVIEKAEVDTRGELVVRSAPVSAIDALIEGATAGTASGARADALPN